MNPVWQTPRAGLLWLLLGLLGVVSGLAPNLPSWLWAVTAFAVGWRLQVYRGAWGYPGRLLKFLLILLAAVLLVNSYSSLGGLATMAALLVTALLLKLLEMHRRRDAIVVVFVAYFAAALILLFDQTMLASLYALCCVILLTAALSGMQQSNRAKNSMPLKRAASMVLQSLPLMLLLFLVMPRLGAFWTVPNLGAAARTGVSETMSPGDITNLSQDSSAAFRVTFEGELPDPSVLYWRGPVLSEFDGRTWRMIEPYMSSDGAYVDWYGQRPSYWQHKIQHLGVPLKYEVVQEPTQMPWLFALAAAQPKSEHVGLTRDLRLVSDGPVSTKSRFRVESWLNHRFFADGLSRYQRRHNLSLPSDSNPKTVALALQLRQRSNSSQEYIRAVLGLYQQELRYTLKPPALGRHSIDDLLFSTKQGFCSHFASSFVFMMRVAGIPARVVTGYQGGERHPEDGYLMVHQFNAHAWTEVWMEDKGWRRIDPTAYIAPDRINLGFERYFAEDENYLSDSPFSLGRYRNIDWINSLRLQMDSLNYYWSRWVLGYEDVQEPLLASILGKVTPLRIALLLLGGGMIVLLLVAWHLLRGRRAGQRYDGLDRHLILFSNKLAKKGLGREMGEGVYSYGDRLRSSPLKQAAEAQQVLMLYRQLRYQTMRVKERQQKREQLKRMVRRFSAELAS